MATLPPPALDRTAPRAAAPVAGYVTRQRLPVSIWPMVIVIYATLVPREICIHLGSNFMFADRLALLLISPWLFRNIWNGAIRFVLPDFLIVLMGVWIAVAYTVVNGFDRGFLGGLGLAVDSVFGYLLARITFRSLNDVRRGFILCIPMIFLCALTLPLESLTHQLLVRPPLEKIFGSVRTAEGSIALHGAQRVEIRHGLLRAYGVWSHPILAGVYLSTQLAVMWSSGIRGLPRWLWLAAISMSVFTLSSATYLSLLLQVMFIGYDYLTRKIKELTWGFFWLVVALVLLFANGASNSGAIGLVIRFLTLDPATGYFRLLIWKFGWLSVVNHPWFGIGLADYSRPSWMISNSIDNHWLLLAIRYGPTASACLLLACFSALFALARCQAYANRRDQRFYRGIMMSLTMMMIMGCTVYIYGGTQTWFTILLGACVACAQHGFFRVVVLPEEERATTA